MTIRFSTPQPALDPLPLPRRRPVRTEVPALAAQGVPILPSYFGCPRLSLRRATADPDQVLAWMAERPGSERVALLTLPFVLLTVAGDDGRRELADLEWELGSLPSTVLSASPRGGLHYWLRRPILLKGAAFSPNVELRAGAGALAVVPPTRHRDGGRHEWLNCPSETDIAELPQAWVDRARLAVSHTLH